MSTSESPYFKLDVSLGTMILEGVSMHEAPQDFYESIFEAVENEIVASGRDWKFDIDMSYFNSVSHKKIVKILKMLEKSSGKVTVNWNYENDDVLIKETGELLATLFPGLQFNLVLKS